MARHKSVWDAVTQTGFTLPLTDEEEKDRDEEEIKAAIITAELAIRDNELALAMAKIQSKEATLDDVINFLSLSASTQY